jgi:hypothetical protein
MTATQKSKEIVWVYDGYRKCFRKCEFGELQEVMPADEFTKSFTVITHKKFREELKDLLFAAEDPTPPSGQPQRKKVSDELLAIAKVILRDGPDT